MKKLILGSVVAVLGLTGILFAFRAAAGRADCPGKIICPITGQEICADQCPLDEQPAAEAPSCCKTPKP